MALADEFDRAEVLDTLSWVCLEADARIKRLANLYLQREHEIESAHRKYEGPTMGTVKVFTRSVYDPPRGQGVMTYEGVLKELPRQRKIRDERKQNPPLSWENDRKALGFPERLNERRNRIGARRFSITVEGYGGKKQKGSHNIIAVTRLAGCVLIADGGQRYGDINPRIWAHHKASGKVKLIVLKLSHASSLTEMLQKMAPTGVMRGMFEGRSITFDFENEGFLMDGKVHPWRHIAKVYTGTIRKRIRSVGRPK